MVRLYGLESVCQVGKGHGAKDHNNQPRAPQPTNLATVKLVYLFAVAPFGNAVAAKADGVAGRLAPIAGRTEGRHDGLSLEDGVVLSVAGNYATVVSASLHGFRFVGESLFASLFCVFVSHCFAWLPLYYCGFA